MLKKLRLRLRFAWLAFKNYDRVIQGLVVTTEFSNDIVNAMPSQIEDLLSKCVRVTRISKATGREFTEPFRLFG